jgi:cystathionine beta-lyase/cystathionine gamma-synthase
LSIGTEDSTKNAHSSGGTGMKLNQQEAYYILSNLETFVSRFESSTSKKVTPGALQIIQELLTEASFPVGMDSNNLH